MKPLDLSNPEMCACSHGNWKLGHKEGAEVRADYIGNCLAAYASKLQVKYCYGCSRCMSDHYATVRSEYATQHSVTC